VLGRLLIFLRRETFLVFLRGILLLNGMHILGQVDCSEAEAGLSRIEGLRSLFIRPGKISFVKADEED
jgi:hypothetical protein